MNKLYNMATTPEQTAQKLAQLLDELDDDYLSKLSDDEVIKLRKELNPYGRTIEGSDKILAFSYTDLSADYLKRMITTAMIGFLNRMLDEWRVNPGIPVVTVYDYVKDPSKIDEFEKTLQDASLMRAELDENKELMKKKVFIKEFLEDMFQYNPDLHVRSAYKPNPYDEERDVLDTPAASLAIAQLKARDPDFREAMFQYERKVALRNKASKSAELDGGVESKRATPSDKSDDDQTKLPSSSGGSDDKPDVESDGKIESSSQPYTADKLREIAASMIPPIDVFHRFQYYYDTNFEELQSIVNDLYCCKPEFTTAINPYAWFDTEAEATDFIDKHKDEVISTIFRAHSGKWNIIAPFKKVRESMRFFNKNTRVLEGIMDQIEQDSKTGQELMKKRIKIQKKKNVEKEGPDDPAFKKWMAQNSTLKDMGATHPDDESDDDLPDDALEVPVFRVSGGGTKINRTKFYTKAEAPDVDSLPNPDINKRQKYREE